MPEYEKKSKLEAKLIRKRESSWLKLNKKQQEQVFLFATDYMDFLSRAKTERKTVTEIIKFVETEDFKALEKVNSLVPGNKVYMVNKAKTIALAVIGKAPLEKGCNIITAHLDCPRLDLKPNPLYEDSDTELALFKTHYYGGIKKYQWTSVPLAIHGRIIRSDGTALDVSIGENTDEPVFAITDLAPHLSRKFQDERKLSEGLKGEELNILVGSIPLNDKHAKNKAKLAILNILNQKYGIVEEDFISAELELVPVGKPRELGFDRSMIGAYGQDDRACAYAAMRALCALKKPRRTCIGLFFDKEEIGSEGNTGAKSTFVELFISALAEKLGVHNLSPVKVLSISKAISADVDVALDPTFKDVHELHNAARLGYGVVIIKYGGIGGKYLSHDAHAEYIAHIRNLFNKHKIAWQIGEIGKVDEGGGGTVAKYLAEYNMDVIDCGPPVLSTHSPFEILSKVDLWWAHQAYRVFLEDMQ